MLSSILGGGDFRTILIELILTMPVILIALTFHEVAHGFVSYKLGDPTAYNLGRLSLNPLRHLDPVGSICMLLFRVGWAKPVPVNSRYYKKPKMGMALTALAGPVTNLILGFLGVILVQLVANIIIRQGQLTQLTEVIYIFFNYFAQMNVYLAVFNLLPIPPFDGSRIAFIFLPSRFYFGIMRYERIIQMVILLVLASEALTLPLNLVSNLILDGMHWLIGWVL